MFLNNGNLQQRRIARRQNPMRGIAAREQHLKEELDGGPDRRRPAKPRQEELTDHRLDLKEQKCGEKNAGGKEKHKTSHDFTAGRGAGKIPG